MDNLNNRCDLPDVGKGNYQTAAIQKAIVGRSYQLFIQVGGKNYESTPETLRVLPEIDKLSSRLVEQRTGSIFDDSPANIIK